MIKLIVTDIDGTILKYNFEFNPEVKACITKLVEDGVRVVLATGRMHSATTYIAEELGLDTPIISYQGGLIKHNGETLYEKYIDPKRAREVILWARENNIHLNLYMDDQLYVENDDEVIRRYTGERKTGYVVKSFDEVELININKLLLVDFESEENIDRYLKYLCDTYPDTHFVKSMPYFCEVCHPQAKKSYAVDFLKDYWGLEREEILTIGDQDNDIELLKAGGIAVAMGNGTQGLKAVADYVTDTVINNGFVKAVERFVYNESKV